MRTAPRSQPPCSTGGLYSTLLISKALKKLRANHMQRPFRSCYLYRGMKNLMVSEDFLLKGGAERACVSTSTDLDVIARYAQSEVPLVFCFKVESPMELGADIKWLSLFPGESEILYPPLTFLKPMFEQRIKNLKQGTVITLKPSFPS
jgi:hypothetical protein